MSEFDWDSSPEVYRTGDKQTLKRKSVNHHTNNVSVDWTCLGDGFSGLHNSNQHKRRRKPTSNCSKLINDELAESESTTVEINDHSSDSEREISPVVSHAINPKKTLHKSSARKRSTIKRPIPDTKCTGSDKLKYYPSSFYNAKFKNSFRFSPETSSHLDEVTIESQSPVKLIGVSSDRSSNPLICGPSRARDDSAATCEEIISPANEVNATQGEGRSGGGLVRRRSGLSARGPRCTSERSASPELEPCDVIETYISSCISTPNSKQHSSSRSNSPEMEMIETFSQSPASQNTTRSLRGSDWLKSTQLKTPKQHDPDEHNDLDESARKNRRKRFIKGGMAEQLQRLLMRQKSAERFHVHIMDSQKGVSSVRKLVLNVSSISNSYAISVIIGVHVAGTGDFGTGSRLTVMIPRARAEQLYLQPGSAIVLLPPWYRLDTITDTPLLLSTLPSSIVTADQLNSQPSSSQSQDF